jgi:hypothetical protein
MVLQCTSVAPWQAAALAQTLLQAPRRVLLRTQFLPPLPLALPPL